jgi:hypothetical protein
MAQVFELYFNPKLKEGLIFDSFCYTPTNVYEKRLGSLYLVGELGNALPQDARFLDNLAQVIKGKFYATPIKSVENGLKDSLKKANEFLEGEVKKDNTSWLGNLNFSVLSIKNFDLNFTKVGKLKIFLLRGGEIIDLGKKLELQEIEPYPLKVFLNIVSGKLANGDLVFVLTKDLFNLFVNENFLTEIAKIQIEGKFSEKELKKVLKEKEGISAEISGICLLISLQPEVLPKKAISFEKEEKMITFGKIFQPFINKIKNLSKISKRLIPKKPEIKIFPLFGIKKLFKEFPTRHQIKFSNELKNKLILILALIFFLILGFFIFQREKRISLKENEKIISQVQEKVNLAESFLTLKNEAKAQETFKEAWKEILPLTEEKNPLKEAQSLKDQIEKNLASLNKLQKIENPEILVEFSEKDFLPQNMIELDKVLYFFNPDYNWLFKFENEEKNKIETAEKLKMAIPFGENSILFFTDRNKLTRFENNQFKETFPLKEPYSDSVFNDFSNFGQNLYFLDSKKGEILKYSFPPNSPQIWLKPETKKVIGAKSMAIDGSVWILTADNKISRYFAGKYQQTLNLDIFPESKNLEKIFTSPNLPYLFILEPAQKRIIILNKTGEIISQFQSEKFDNLKDFVVSFEDGKIYLLNGLKVYQVKFK